jgi:hypothetical protein
MQLKFATSAAVLVLAAIAFSLSPDFAYAASKKLPGGVATGKLKGSTVMQLTTSDCRKVDGTVIHVADDRCGGSHQYCKLSNGNAVCIDKAD